MTSNEARVEKEDEKDNSHASINDIVKSFEQRSENLKKFIEVSKKRKALWIVLLSIGLFILLLTGLSIGGASFSIAESWQALISGFSLHKDEMENAQRIIWQLRVPRVLMGIVCGMGLSLAGLVMQTILRNPLASPYTLGISSAASFGAAISIVTGLSVSSVFVKVLPENIILTVNAFVFCMACTFGIYALSKTRKVTAQTIVLFGIAMNFLFSAATSLLQYLGDSDQLAALVYWMFGSLSKTTWSKFYIALVVVAVIIVLTYIKALDFNALMIGDESATSLGVNVERLRIYGLILSSIVTATVVSMLGPIGFIGLVAPHLSRLMVGTNHRILIPVSCLLGGCLLLGADIISTVLLAPVIIPVGIVTSFVGVPLMVVLIIGRRQSQ